MMQEFVRIPQFVITSVFQVDFDDVIIRNAILDKCIRIKVEQQIGFAERRNPVITFIMPL